LLLQHRIGVKEPGRFHIDDELRVGDARREIARDEHADFVGENLVTAIVDKCAQAGLARLP
jgi:hypothetical protein